MWHYVYILENDEGRQYVGSAQDVKKRLEKHNNGEVPHTSKYHPWKLKFACSFPSKEQALVFEKYLKSGSGTTFRYLHLVPNKKRVIQKLVPTAPPYMTWKNESFLLDKNFEDLGGFCRV